MHLILEYLRADIRVLDTLRNQTLRNGHHGQDRRLMFTVDGVLLYEVAFSLEPLSLI
jgi:hypothetical protein